MIAATNFMLSLMEKSREYHSVSIVYCSNAQRRAQNQTRYVVRKRNGELAVACLGVRKCDSQ